MKAVHGSTCGVHRSGGGGLCCRFFFRPCFLLASTAKGAERVAASPAAPKVISEPRRETPPAACRVKLSNDRSSIVKVPPRTNVGSRRRSRALRVPHCVLGAER